MSYVYDVYNRAYWAKVDHERRIQEHIDRTPEQRKAYREKLNEMFAEWSANRLHFGLAYLDALYEREASVKAAEKRLSEGEQS